MYILGAWGGVVDKALLYYSDGPGIDSRWCHWIFQWHIPSDRTMAQGSTQSLVKMSTRNIRGGKGGRCVRLTTSWNPLGHTGPVMGLLYLIYLYILCFLIVGDNWLWAKQLRPPLKAYTRAGTYNVLARLTAVHNSWIDYCKQSSWLSSRVVEHDPWQAALWQVKMSPHVFGGTPAGGGAVTLGWVREYTDVSARACCIITDASFEGSCLFYVAQFNAWTNTSRYHTNIKPLHSFGQLIQRVAVGILKCE
jgi:hypothetical protein